MSRLWQGLTRARPLVNAIALAAIVISVGVNVVRTSSRATAQDVAYTWLRDVGTYVAAHSTGTCSVLASDVPQVTWYSSCATVGFGDVNADTADRRLFGHDRWLVLRADGHFQPSAAVVAGYLRRASTQPELVERFPDGRLRASVYRFETPPPIP